MADNNGKFPPMSDAMGMKLIAERKANAKANESARMEGAGKQSAAKAKEVAAKLAKKRADINKPAKGSVSFDKYKSGNFNGFTMKGPKG